MVIIIYLPTCIVGIIFLLLLGEKKSKYTKMKFLKEKKKKIMCFLLGGYLRVLMGRGWVLKFCTHSG